MPEPVPPHENDQTAPGHGDVLELHRQTQIVQRRDLRGDHPQHHAGRTPLGEGIHAKAGNPGQTDGEVALLGPFEFRRLAVIHDGTHQHLGMGRRQRLIGDGGHLAVDLHGRRRTHGNEQVGALLAQEGLEQVVHEAYGLVAIHGTAPRAINCGWPGRVATGCPGWRPCGGPLPC